MARKSDVSTEGASATWQRADVPAEAPVEAVPQPGPTPAPEPAPDETPLQAAEKHLQRIHDYGDLVGWRTTLPQDVRDQLDQATKYVAEHPDATDKSARVRIAGLAEKMDARERDVMSERAMQQEAVNAVNVANGAARGGTGVNTGANTGGQGE